MDNDIKIPPPSDEIIDDPHASKISPDDPRLKLPSQQSRSLKKGPVIAIGSVLLTILLVALTLAIWPKERTMRAQKEDVAVNQPFALPESIKRAPGNDAPVMLPPADSIPRLGRPLPGDLGHAMVNRNQGNVQTKAQTPEEVERDAALKASPFFGGGGSFSASVTPSSLALPASSSGSDGSGYGGGQNMQDRKNDFFARGGGDEKEYLSQGMHQPRSQYEVKAGSIISVLLVTGINSDLPGKVIGMVKENVYDTRSGDYLLIPQGTRVLGKYDSMISYGQKRVQVSWSRMIRPDGSSLIIENMPGVDLAGSAGYKGKVDNHVDRLVGGAVLSSLLSVGATVSQGSYTDEASMSMQQRMAASVGQNIATTGSQITRKNLDIQPTLIIQAGKAVNILVNKDMIISPYNSKG